MDDHPILEAAAKLERRFPEQIAAFYLTGLGKLDASEPRATYARKARIALKLRRVWVDVARTPERWREFAGRVKALNQRRPAFQEEFARVIPDWENA